MLAGRGPNLSVLPLFAIRANLGTINSITLGRFNFLEENLKQPCARPGFYITRDVAGISAGAGVESGKNVWDLMSSTIFISEISIFYCSLKY